MNSLETLFPFVSVPLLFVLLGAGLLVAWMLRRTHRELLWQAACMWLLAFAYAMSAESWVHWPSHIVVAWTLWCAAWAAAQAISLRYGQSVKAYIAVLCSVLMLCMSWLSAVAEWPAYTHGMLGALALGLILAHVLPSVWRSAPRHRADQVLRSTYSVVTVLLLGLPWLSDHALSAWLGLWMALGLSACMAICVWCDTATKPRTAQYRDASTQMLNRAGLDAVCSGALAEHGITVVVLCEFKPAARSGKSAFSHKAALRAFAQLLQNSVREGDWLARTGAEEFVLALRQMDMEQAQALVARLQLAMPRSPGLERYTASFGMAQVQEADSMDVALHRADVALYQTKEENVRSEHLASAF